jgi:hypothetical protein
MSDKYTLIFERTPILNAKIKIYKLPNIVDLRDKINTIFNNDITILFCIKFQNTSNFDNLSIINNNYQEKFIYIMAIKLNHTLRHLK